MHNRSYDKPDGKVRRKGASSVVDDLLNAVAASEFNEDLDVNFPISISYNHILCI